MQDYRHTKIIATIGPATQSPEKLAALIEAGVDVMRLNMAHGTPEWVLEIVARIRSVSKSIHRHVAVMMDVKGPEIRTGAVDDPIELKAGDELVLFTDECSNQSALESDGTPRVSVNYPGLPGAIDLDSTILVDSGLLHWHVLAKDATTIRCRVITPGVLESRRHINLPGIQVNLPAITDKDKTDLIAGIEAGIDFVALSFVRQAEDVETLREFLDQHDSHARIISKIEDQAGVRNMEAIIRQSDAIMVARGDLGIEIDYHRLPLVQTELIRACQVEGKPVIIATHLLESMIHSPVPTRAEVSDVCNAIREQADAVMLSGETTTGKYPLESVGVLQNIIGSIEPTVSRQLNSKIVLREPKSKMLRSSAILAQELGESGIVVFTRSGFLAYVLGALRPRGVPIFAFTDIEHTFHHLLLPWGVEPFLMDFSEDHDETISNALEILKEKGWCKPGMWLGVITNALADEKIVDTLQLREVQ
ncbi:pyruvate kinase [Rhodopirellula sp. JC740]|uniref:Pyruvate kinase n=1 Tax=Rhodopirellula halodulae TaxID=2894198 RepID=A0ABS8NFG9_9BACT|nr:pyruvate kinase [Rhodopirellula sp. JC737]MCC9642302.1 pyruvate kinase [Rhodopirellula sp. JC740]MCC9654372.1 pyruvate kinase [Rhodopirellula sp. JC737]